MSAAVYSTAQVAEHCTEGDAWLIIEGGVYDVTPFIDDHPGGRSILLKACGTDATEVFWQFHSAKVLKRHAAPLLIGKVGAVVAAAELAAVAPPAAPVAEESPVVEVAAVVEEPAVVEEDTDTFGDLVPYGDPLYYSGFASPYYNENHFKVRAAGRKYTDKFLTPFALEWDDAREIPVEDYRRAASSGILGGIIAPPGWFTEHAEGIPIPGGIAAKDWDSFCNFILIDEICRSGSGGIVYGLAGGFGISLPTVLHFGSDELRARIVPECLKGTKRICLAITEPSGGSDVANVTTNAVKSADGKHYIVNGEKKWITGGIHADYIVTAVRTGGNGFGGISLLLIERSKGVTTRKMDCSGVLASGTSYVTFEDVKVPVENLIGQENKGFALIMANFNPERIGIAIQANRFARVCLESSIVYASKRKTFGVLLRDHPVIRAKLADMARKVESTHAWIETIIYQSTKFAEDDLSLRLGGPVALLKAHATDTFEFCAREAAQIFGGLAYTKGGQGEMVERLNREVLAHKIPGGSSEIMLDLGMRQSIKIAEIMGAKL